MDHVQGLAKLAIEYWRLLRIYERAVAEQSPDKHPKGKAQLRYASNKLENILNGNSLRLIEYEGQAYSPNLPVNVANGEDFESNEGLFIEQTLEPTVVRGGTVLMLGKVILRKGE